MTGTAPVPPRSDAQPAPWVLDVLLALGVALTVSLLIAADVQGTDPGGWAYLWAAGLGSLLLARRRFPVAVLVLSAAALLAYYSTGQTAIGLAVPLAAAAYSAAERGRTRATIVLSAVVLALSILYRLGTGQDPTYVLAYDLPGNALLLAAAIALGESVRSRRKIQRQAREITALTVERTEREAEQRAMAERLAIARELHDSMGHALTVVNLHTQIAEEALDGGKNAAPEQQGLSEALRVIAETTSSTFEDLRRTVAGLRTEGGRAREPLRIQDLDGAVLPARKAGIDVSLHVHVRPALPGIVEAAIYRIVQESITNVVRHSDASRVEVEVRESEGTATVSILNDSRSGLSSLEGAVSAGSGLEGMRERTTLLGGTFSAGPRESGFEVRASIPLEVTT